MDQRKKPARLYKTPVKKNHEDGHRWFVLDAAGKTLGRFASEVAKILRGKHVPGFTPHADVGDGVIVINVDKIAVTGSKSARKTYHYYTGYVSGLREIPYSVMQSRKPAYIIEHAVKGMMPRTSLARKQLKRLRLFVGTEHQMDAQQPVTVNI